MANSSETDSAVRQDVRKGRFDAWHLWRVIMPRRSIAGRLVWGWYGGATAGGAGCTKNSSSIRTTVIRNLSPKSTPAGQLEIISGAAVRRSSNDGSNEIQRFENDRVQSI
jgi:hypothetical protein